MESAETTVVLDGALAEAERGRSDETAMREAMLEAIGELSDAERERLGTARQPEDMALAWRDLIAERAAREREATVRSELTREFQAGREAAQQRPTQGLHGRAPASTPESVTDWTDFIRSGKGESLQERRREQFAQWLAAHPEA